MTIAFSGSGARAAIWSELKPPQEIPNMPTFPEHQGCSASQLTTATPSASSCASYSSPGIPSEFPCPRTSTRTEAYPWPAYQGWRCQSRGAVQSLRRYGRYSSSAGTGSGPVGRQILA